ncbi:ribosomal-protein-alanine N-acetyltransferase [Arenibacter nanhaiticus]|uniref:Ribosomal-protein-alanine N-acetyltransferase n=1 Tax=Arenibacter nanhaiticus TaxID=558155 RepID=A0A1M6LEA4_9FLAO|nr:N-acetyltransferase [Arenibacter nanhaiticus]SHJ69540.1 ribosomal-protein-alanine N-acetyltransferase [Arenibacter nanhaiticus]
MITITKATIQDLKVVHEIETMCFKDGSYPLFVLRQLFDISEDYFLIAKEGDEVLGYVLGNLSANTNQAWILSVGVRPAARGKQIGKKLTEELIGLLENNHCKEICLTVHPKNASALHIYKKLGFVVFSASDNYYLDNDERLLMKKKTEVSAQ